MVRLDVEDPAKMFVIASFGLTDVLFVAQQVASHKIARIRSTEQLILR